jgi:hypothetical protein
MCSRVQQDGCGMIITNKLSQHMDSSETLSNRGQDGPSATHQRKKILLVVVVVAIVIIAGVWIGKEIHINNLRRTSARNLDQLEINARQEVINSHKQHLRLLAKPFVWAVRTELMNNNMSQINQYINDLVKEKNISSIIVVNPAGKIISSTNKKWENTDFSNIGEVAHLSSDTTMVQNIADSILIMSSPVMGFNNRLGTVVVRYSVGDLQIDAESIE